MILGDEFGSFLISLLSSIRFRIYSFPKDAIVVNTLPFTSHYTTLSALSDLSDDACGLDSLVYGVWFTFTPSFTTTVQLEISLPEYSLEFGVMCREQDESATCLRVFDAGTFFRTDVYAFEWNAIAGNQYEILVADQSPMFNGEFSFTLKVSTSTNNTPLPWERISRRPKNLTARICSPRQPIGGDYLMEPLNQVSPVGPTVPAPSPLAPYVTCDTAFSIESLPFNDTRPPFTEIDGIKSLLENDACDSEEGLW